MKKASSRWNHILVLWLVFAASAVGLLPGGRGGVLAPDTARADTPAEELQAEFIRVAEKVKQSVVGISAEGGKPEDDDAPLPLPPPRGPNARKGVAFGTGIIISADGLILTNSHVVRRATNIWVIFNAERRDEEKARVVGVDPVSDLAVLKVDRKGLTPIEFGDSDAIKVGAWVIAIGNPFRQTLTVTTGIVSGKGRHLAEREGARNFQSLQDYIQTDAAINPGNSGGPLVDIHGKLIGINTAILSPSMGGTGGNVGIGFAVPVSTVKKVLPRLMRGERITRGFLGIEYSELRRQDAQAIGLPNGGGFQISRVRESTPAAEAGLQKGDIIIGYSSQAADSSEAFRQLVSDTAPGTRLPLRIVRFTDEGPKELVLTVTLRERDRAEEADNVVPASERKSLLGMTVEDVSALDGSTRKDLGIRQGKEGAVITQVEPGGPADEARIEAGVFVRKAKVGDAKTFTTIRRARDFENLLSSLKPGTQVVLWLEDIDDSGQYVALTARSPEADKK